MLISLTLVAGIFTVDTSAKVRAIQMTDGEVDDMCSMDRFLLYTNEIQVEGLVYVDSRYHSYGHSWNGTQWIQNKIAQYGQCLSNLRIHDPEYPSVAYLLSKVKKGDTVDLNMDAVGPNKDSDGSNLVVSVLLDTNPAPVWICVWGCTNTFAQAMFRIKTSYPDKLAYAVRKAILYYIWDQETTNKSFDWLRTTFPDMLMIQNMFEFGAIAYSTWMRYVPADTASWIEDSIAVNVVKNHGPIAAHGYNTEGDSPSFMHLMNTGLRSVEDPSWGGWGGRFALHDKNYWPDTALPEFRNNLDNQTKQREFWRWLPDLERDYFARADWCITSNFSGANHHPVVTLLTDSNLTVSYGATVTLKATAHDTDGNALTYSWWQYKGPGNYSGDLVINNAKQLQASFTAPKLTAPKTAHIVLSVTDNGKPQLTRYRRVVVTFDSAHTTAVASFTSLANRSVNAEALFSFESNRRIIAVTFPSLNDRMDVACAIFTVSGKLVAGALYERNGSVMKIVVKNVPNGIYFVRFVVDGITFKKTFILQK
jgi:hypothetical protein